MSLSRLQSFIMRMPRLAMFPSLLCVRSLYRLKFFRRTNCNAWRENPRGECKEIGGGRIPIDLYGRTLPGNLRGRDCKLS